MCVCVRERERVLKGYCHSNKIPLCYANVCVNNYRATFTQVLMDETAQPRRPVAFFVIVHLIPSSAHCTHSIEVGKQNTIFYKWS